MNKLICVYSVALFLAFSILCFGDSKKLSSDVERSDSYGNALSLRSDFKNKKLQERAVKTIENIVRTSGGELKKKGAEKLAERINLEWDTKYRNLFLSRIIGDHDGIEWLLKIHTEIEFVLGENICRTLRLHDLWTLAHTIPVVFNCIDKVDIVEYALHFIPFGAITSYWTSFGVCMGATLGTGVGFVCGFLAMGVEQICLQFIAPPLVPNAYEWACE